ncbi:radical SAM protein, partial [Tyzzerella sp. OttesenSCG-928-J15]|nr:radical SAM protein [Tyzzerella sp. OttesenSCG-928-J15]
STMINCVYNCEYCYLQGMYPSANIVVFVNMEDYFEHIESVLKQHPLYLCISYDTDILALENILSYGRKWVNFAAKNSGLHMELRTKSANFKLLKDIQPAENIIIAWTLSPDEIIGKFEHKTPELGKRLEDIKSAMKSGWNTRLCFDPMVYCDNFEKVYGEFFEKTFGIIDGSKLLDISLGTFRVSKDYLKNMRRANKFSPLTQYPYDISEGMAVYNKHVNEEMLKFAYSKVSKYINGEKIFLS